MTSSSVNIGSAAATPDAAYGASSQAAYDNLMATGQPSLEQETLDSADFRLVIEDDQAAGSYVYKTIDRRTGEVVQQYPREEILRLREATDYSAGAVIKAKA